MANVLEITTRIIAEKAELDPKELSAESILADLDIQSLELAEIIFDLEEEFDIEIELNAAAAWEKLKTVGDVATAVGELADQGA
ncbi:phosphopantetheine-binding protein [Oricola sp.]|uniref:phosphopantetheine-binding protein n=1 Tax=Oricola sp. TaxID=1979950 RepID=UPI003BAC4555